MNDTTLTIAGNLTSDPDLRFTPSGVAVANFTVAATPKRRDHNSGEWTDGETLFLRCRVWRADAENFAESAHSGDRVIATGRLRPHTFERGEEKRTVIELDVDEVALSTKFATVRATRNPRRDRTTT